MNKNIIFSSTKQKKMISRSFLVAGLSFLLVCLIGYISSLIVDSAGLLKGVNTNTKFDFAFYEAYGKLAKLSMTAGILILISMFMSIYWQFRFLKISNTFIYIAFSTYVLAQGFGFGVLFATWNAVELIGIFAIAGGLFMAMGTYGYFAKNLSSWGRILFIYSLIVLGMWLISYLLIYFGLINAKATYSMITVAFGLLFLGYTAYDVWLLKKTSQWQEARGNLDEKMEHRLILFFGFRLLVDLIGIVWMIVRFVIINKS